MNIVLLSGGSGKRLWPLSNDIRSKQFIKVFKKEDGSYESMVQRVYRQIRMVDGGAPVTIAASKSQVSTIHNQLGNEVEVCVEPCRRDTFPAIALTAAYLHDVKKVSDEEVIVVCPVDPYVEDDYFKALMQLGEVVQKGDTNLVLMGIEPTYPSEKYGYIIPENKDTISPVVTFKEKPDKNMANCYIQEGAIWNGGIFGFKLKYILKIAHKLIDFKDYWDLYNKYEIVEKISFDYAVVEKEKKIQVMRFSGEWKDLGTWSTLTEEMAEPVIGNAMINEECKNINVINELDIPILCMGLKNMIVSASAEGILVSDKEQSASIKSFVDCIEQQVMFAEKSWGYFKVIDVEDKSMTIKLLVHAGKSMNYHSHLFRDEIWAVLEGVGILVRNGINKNVKSGDIIKILKEDKHTIIAETDMKLIEIQLGDNINVCDKCKY